MKHQHFDRNLINEMKTSSDTSKHIASYKSLVGGEKKQTPGHLWQLYEHVTGGVWMSLNSGRGKSIEQRRKNKLLEKISSFISCAVCITEDGMCLFQHFFSIFNKKHCVLSWECLLHLMQEPGDLTALLLCNLTDFYHPV